MILLIMSQTAYSQKTRRSDLKAEKQPMERPLRADIFGQCYEDYYVYNEDGSIDTVYAPNWKRPDCFGSEIKKPDYRKTGMRNTPVKGKTRMRRPERKPVDEMTATTHDSKWANSISHLKEDGNTPACQDFGLAIQLLKNQAELGYRRGGGRLRCHYGEL